MENGERGHMTAESAPLTPAEVARALGQGGVEVAYQPCWDLRTGAMVAVEALARLRHPTTGEVVGPERFLDVAEQAGLVRQLDDVVLRQATAQLGRWRRLPGAEGLCVSINLSVGGLDDATAADRFAEAAAEARIPTDAIIVELTETVLSRAGRGHEQVVAALGDLGCNVTLDDFGTGNASFEYLQRFRIAGIKVDRSFVQYLGSGGRGERLAEALLTFCLSLRVHVVAEGVETVQQLEALRRLGCPLVQGFLLSRPRSSEEVERLLRQEEAPPAELRPRPSPAPHGPLGAGEEAVPGARRVEPVRRRWASYRQGRRVTVALAVLVALLLVGLPAYAIRARSEASDRLAGSAQDRLEAVTTLAASRVNSEVDALTGVVSAYSRSDPIRSALAGEDPAAVEDALATMVATGPDIFSASLNDADGRLLAVHPQAPELVGRTFAYRDYFTGAVATPGTYVSESFQLASEGQPWVVAVSAAVRGPAGEVEGVLVATVSLERLQSELRGVLDQHGAAVTLTDSRTRILASPEGDIGAPATDPRLLEETSDEAQDPGGEDEVLWAVRPVPSVGGWLLAEQTPESALGPDADNEVTGNWGIGLLSGLGLVVLLLWLRADLRRRRLATDVDRAHRQLTQIVTATPAPIVVSDDQDRVVLANPAFAALVGVEHVDDLLGNALAGWLPVRGGVDTAAGGTLDVQDYASTVITTVGDVRTVEVHTQVLGGDHGDLFLHTIADVTPYRREHDRLRAQGRRDPLTGVANRVALQEALAAAVQQTTVSYAVVMLDLDGFKKVNDAQGHAVGDQLLCAVADLLSASRGPNDLVARPGGDEFVVVLRLDRPDQGRLLGELLRRQVIAGLADHPDIGGSTVGVSIGVAVVGEDGHDPATLLQVADQRMYRAKRSGR